MAARLRRAGVSCVSVAISTADPAQYVQRMQPEKLRYSPVFSLSLGLDEVCNFVTHCVVNELEVECTAVAAPDVDLGATRRLAQSLGASFRSRSWHP